MGLGGGGIFCWGSFVTPTYSPMLMPDYVAVGIRSALSTPINRKQAFSHVMVKT